VEKAYHWLLAQGIRPEIIASIGYSIGGNVPKLPPVHRMRPASAGSISMHPDSSR
jgi:hypothetical protein